MSDISETDRMQKLSDFLTKSYHGWASRHIRGSSYPSQNEYAKTLGIKQSTWSSWINATRLPTAELADLLAEKLGDEIYEICGLAPRMPRDPMLSFIWPVIKQAYFFTGVIEQMSQNTDYRFDEWFIEDFRQLPFYWRAWLVLRVWAWTLKNRAAFP